MKTDFNSIDAGAATLAPGPAAALPDAWVCLTELVPGEAARIRQVRSLDGIGRRLLDLGFIPGTPLRVVRRAPLGDPVCYELRGSRICLRRSEAMRIRVERTPRAAGRP